MTLYKSRVLKSVAATSTLVMLLFSVSMVFSYTVFEQRFKLLQKKAEAGDKRAQYKIGVAYMRGTSTNFDKVKAVKWFMKAAKKGYVKAWFRLGQINFEPRYGIKNYKTAFKWFTKAARKNHGVSQYYLALHYHLGKGVHKDIDYALVWANRAKKSGVSDARALLRKLNNKTAVSIPVQRVRSSAPKPKKSRKSVRNDVASPRRLNVRRILVAGGWNEGDFPSNYIPSNSNKCIEINTKIRCTSKRLRRTHTDYTASYKLVSLISDFTSNGVFKIQTRYNYLFILPEDPDDPNPKTNMPSTGFSEKISVMNCKMIGKSRIRCHKADKSIIRFTKK